MNQATTIAAYLREKLPFAPDIALVLGSGLGGLAEQIENAVIIPYRSVPGFPVSTAPGHAGQFVAGQLAGKNVLCQVLGKGIIIEIAHTQSIGIPCPSRPCIYPRNSRSVI